MATPLVKVGYAEPILPDVTRVLACLNEKDIKFEHVDISKGKHSGHAVDKLLNLQAKASTRLHGPAFDDGKETLFESRAICRYLVEKYADRGNRTLLGRDSLERLSVEQWLKSEEHSFDPPSWTLVFYLAYAPAMGLKQDDAAVKESEGRLSKVLDVYNQRLADNKFLAGNEFTLADLFHLPNSYCLAKQDAFTSRENVSRWVRDMCDRQSWKRVTELLKLAPVERVPILAVDRPSLPHQSQHFASAPLPTNIAVSPPVQTSDNALINTTPPSSGAAHRSTTSSPSSSSSTDGDTRGIPIGSADQKTSKPVVSSNTSQDKGQGTDGKKSGQQPKDNGPQDSTNAAEEATTAPRPTTNNKKQDRTRQQTQESKTHSGSANKETPKPGASGTAEGKDFARAADIASPPSGLKNAAVAQDNSEQDSKASTTSPSSTYQGPPKEEVSNTADKNGTSPSGQGTKEKESGQKSNNNVSQDSTKQGDKISPPSESKNAANQDNSKQDLQHSKTPSRSTKEGPPKQVVSNTADKKGSSPSGEGRNDRESGQTTKNVTQDSTKPMNSVPPPSGLKNAAVDQDNSMQDSKASTTSPSSTYQGPPKEEVSNTSDKNGSQNAAENQEHSEQYSKASTTSSSSRNQGPPKQEVSNAADKKGSKNAAENQDNSNQDLKQSTKPSSSTNEGSPKDSTEPADKNSPPSEPKNAAANQDNAKQDLKQLTPLSSSTKEGPPKAEVSDTAAEKGTNYNESSDKSDIISKDSTKPTDNAPPPSGSKNAAVNQEHSEQLAKASTTSPSSTNQRPPKETVYNAADVKDSPLGQGTNDKNSGQKSDNNISHDSTKPDGDVSPPTGSKKAAENQATSNQDLKQSTRPSSSTNEGPPKDSSPSVQGRNDKEPSQKSNNVPEDFTKPVVKVSPPSESKNAQEKSGHKSDNNISKDSTKPVDNVFPPSGSKNAAENQDNSNQDLKQSTKPLSSTNERSPKEDVSNTEDQKGLKNAAEKQNNSNQDLEQSTTPWSTTNEGPPKDSSPSGQGRNDKRPSQKSNNNVSKDSTVPVDKFSPPSESKNAAKNQDNSQQDLKQSTTLSRSTKQGPPEEEVSNTANDKGTNDKESGHKSNDSTKPVDNVSGTKNAAVNKDSHHSVPGSEQTGSPSAGTSQPAS